MARSTGDGSLGPDAGHTISTITDGGGGVALVTTAGDHKLLTGMIIRISGSSVAGYNTTWLVQDATAASNKFTIDTYTADATGGRWKVGA